MVDICRRVDVDTLMSNQVWGFNEFQTALLRHSGQVGLATFKILSSFLAVGGRHQPI